jgi:hypothetical protein
MATHHGRPGGRGLELLVMLFAVLLTATILFGGIAGLFALQMVFLAPLLRISPGMLAALNGVLLTYWYKPGAKLAWAICAAIWTPILSYYKYEPHTLKPIFEERPHDRKSD